MPSSTESTFVGIAQDVVHTLLQPPLFIERGQPLLYELKVSDALEVMQPAQIKKPKRGRSAFEADLCIFEEVSEGVRIPRVVTEFKTRITTHDVLTYSAKAERHKCIYWYTAVLQSTFGAAKHGRLMKWTHPSCGISAC